VECHKNYPDKGMDFRLTVILKHWRNHPDPNHLKKAQAAMPEGVILTGNHPDVQALIKEIPTDCLMCHWRGAEKAPPFSRMLHLFHLVGGSDNHYIVKYRGVCMNCHKLDQKTGTWNIGKGKE
jgi:hypothetical protein